jgi:hypothetical protein
MGSPLGICSVEKVEFLFKMAPQSWPDKSLKSTHVFIVEERKATVVVPSGGKIKIFSKFSSFLSKLL